MGIETPEDFRNALEVLVKRQWNDEREWVICMGNRTQRKFDALLRLQGMKMFEEITPEEYFSLTTMINSDDEGNLTMAEMIMANLVRLRTKSLE